MMRLLFLVLIAAMGFGCIVRPTEKRIVYKAFDTPRTDDSLQVTSTEQAVPDSSNTTLVNPEQEQQLIEEPVMAEEKPAQPNVATSTVMRFHLVAASFKNSSNAENFHAKLLAEGYQSRLIVLDTAKSTSPYKVSFVSFATKDEAQSELKKQLNNGAFPQTWILETKP